MAAIYAALSIQSATISEPEPEWLPFEATAEQESETWVKFTATAYTARCSGCTGITKSGIDVRRTTTYDGRTVVAVDPRVIPLGSSVEIRLADGTIIEGTAQDVGSAIKGNRIDVLMATKSEMRAFGRQSVEVRVVNE